MSAKRESPQGEMKVKPVIDETLVAEFAETFVDRIADAFERKVRERFGLDIGDISGSPPADAS